MWKIVVGFIVFAALALYMLTKGGDLDMGGEKHGALLTDTNVADAGFASAARHACGMTRA